MSEAAGGHGLGGQTCPGITAVAVVCWLAGWLVGWLVGFLWFALLCVVLFCLFCFWFVLFWLVGLFACLFVCLWLSLSVVGSWHTQIVYMALVALGSPVGVQDDGSLTQKMFLSQIVLPGFAGSKTHSVFHFLH